MKILVIPTTDWIRHPNPNRLNFIFDNLAEKHEVYVLHFGLKKFQSQEPRETKCRLVTASGIAVGDQSLYYLLNFFYHAWKIKSTAKREKIDLILSSNILPSFAANFAGVPVVFDYLDHLQESASVYYPGSALGEIVKAVVSSIVRFNIRKANFIITVTEEFKCLLEGMGAKKVAVIPNGVDTSLLKPLSKEESKRNLGLEGDVLGYVGALEHWVDLETVVEAMPFLDAKLMIVGPGLFTDYGDKIKSLAEERGVRDKIIFTGAIKYSDLGKYISAMDIGLNPLKDMTKNQETVGGKVFNYLSCERPVLSSRMIALERLLGSEIYYYDDAMSFVSQVKLIMNSSIDKERLRAVAKRFDWRKIALDYEGALQKALDEER
ncbi:D-inositol-3-phosphate glycosyltransferase [uncultured archaeon]|nr:D-inositol-3-phosphate glycosyltransferase [uncultured archaeon]